MSYRNDVSKYLAQTERTKRTMTAKKWDRILNWHLKHNGSWSEGMCEAAVTKEYGPRPADDAKGAK